MRWPTRLPLLTLLAATMLTANGTAGAAPSVSLLVAAASSLSDVLPTLGRDFAAETAVVVRFNFGGSNTLARQIVAGAPVDAFISADGAHMDAVEKAGRLQTGSRAALLTNTLVVIVPAQSRVTVRGARDLALPAVRRIAVGDPESVPAGVYARRWLEQIELWGTLKGKLVPLPTVRAALAAVREGRAEAGIVYATDARASRDVQVAFAPDPNHVPAIVYPAAVIAGARHADAAKLLDFLRTPHARALFEAAGFGVLPAR